MAALGVGLPERIQSGFGRQPVVGSHGLADHELFSDAALIELLDHFPRQHLYALNMGTDPTRVEENRLALHEGVGGAELLLAVKTGRLWLNVTRVDRADAQYRRSVLHRAIHGADAFCSADSNSFVVVMSTKVITTPSIALSSLRYGMMRTESHRPSVVGTCFSEN